jgi:hypothetical protein
MLASASQRGGTPGGFLDPLHLVFDQRGHHPPGVTAIPGAGDIDAEPCLLADRVPQNRHVGGVGARRLALRESGEPPLLRPEPRLGDPPRDVTGQRMVDVETERGRVDRYPFAPSTAEKIRD